MEIRQSVLINTLSHAGMPTQPKPMLIKYLSWWNSLEAVSTISIVLKFAAAIFTILVLVLGLQEAKLRKRAQSKEHDKLAATEKTIARQEKQIHSIRYGRRAGDDF